VLSVFVQCVEHTKEKIYLDGDVELFVVEIVVFVVVDKSVVELFVVEIVLVVLVLAC
jgi:hypothetical protein